MTEHEIRKVEVEAFVYSRETPTDEQLKKVQDFLEKKYNAAVAVIPKQDDSVRDGFRIEIGTSTYKWNAYSTGAPRDAQSSSSRAFPRLSAASRTSCR